MKSKLQMLAASVLMTASALWLTSCSSDDVVQSGTSKADLTLTLAINTGNAGTRATAWDGTTTTPDASDENTINRLTVGIFDKDTKKVKTIVELTTATTGGNSMQQTQGGGATAKIVTTSLVSGDDILVAANAPTGTFAGASDETKFKERTEDFEFAVTKDGTVVDATKERNTNIPMFGSATLTSNDGSNFTANVTVQHQLAKVTLESLTVDFKADGPYKDATFQPTEFFVVNVPTSLQFSETAVEASASLLHGLNNTTFTSVTTIPQDWGTYKDYLTTGDLSASSTELKGLASGSDAKYSSKAFFYVTPSSRTKTTGNNMKLFIAGNFKADGTGAGETVFYPVNLNATYDASGNATAAANGSAVYTISPNKNYKCSVVIRTKGLTDPTSGDLDPQTAQITVNVEGFVDADQSTTFE